MSPPIVGLVTLGILFLVMAFGIPIGFAMALTGFGGLIYLMGLSPALSTIGLMPFSTSSNYVLSILPLFILMGIWAGYAGLTRGAYDAGHKLLGHLPGGLAMANVVGCAIFSAVSGSSLACAAAMGSICMPQMRRYKYDPALATGSIAAGAVLDIMIPPSAGMVIYALITESSIGKLLIAGIFPGAMLAVLMMVTVYVLVKWNPSLAPPAVKASFKERLFAFKDVWGIALLFIVVLGGIYGGVFTPTEAAAIGAFGAFLFLVFSGQLNRKTLKTSLLDTVRPTAMIFTIIIGAMIFNSLLAVSRLPMMLADWVGGLPLHKYGILAVILLTYVPLGMVMDTLAMVLLTVPIYFPLVQALGIDPIWFGIMIIVMMEIGMLTPPVGVVVFVLRGVAKDVPMYTIFKGVVPFVIAMIVGLALIIIFPQISLFLPNAMLQR